ncbi:hypothetical protein VCSRO208_1457 [Vibrio cholerae]|nr:hypothetical protein [Vibrio cholerae]EGR3626617.1 hypothetical protein [Vibrio cholerae]EGR4324989.1 hypothetical protein [Vibrio cholerae]KOE80497.1 hypothetical protein ACS86_17345 [Vibrio alginolyticus]GHX66456.1 hypothetical protein VCSRO208_1457 [Vibrio cholerae]
MLIKPLNTKWYIFGSYLHSDSPSDIDLLVVYDPQEVHPKDVTKHCKPLFDAIEQAISLKVHSTILTCSEERESEFVERSKALPLEKVLTL